MPGYGDPRLLPRFWNKVTINPDTGCWEWTGALFPGAGYGAFRHGGKIVRSHRLTYEVLVGPIADGLQIDHLCRVRACCNPGHLEPVTQHVNLHRGQTITAKNASQTHCPRGHPYSGSNLYIAPKSQGRRCRACNRDRANAHYAATRVA